ncbi:efflux RND transporter periplasmic adaptor subunit [Chelativorans salis]|uniref:Efflux RND transporter periplasmic adaptor subunit n=1 Tax=Chelativorans salis TaxID=2978478 RepID=A0ABT2LUD6_9HYPH|nr:efflux RND transporter periplasmic adaptor subunit [Chelativorans sp. EGI FJ00035]MCT7377684.1 efflux RND transporter periplasmic adaptor subunit [Chelativorans sp. EGI FJ00035]
MSALHRSGALALAALLLAACSESEANKAEEPQVQTVVIEPVSEFAAIGTRNFVGRLAPVSTVDVSFRVGGELIDLPVSEGTKVEKGGLLAALDPTDYELALRQAQLSAELAKADFERKEKLLASKSISRSAYDQSKTDYELQEVAVENAQRDLSEATIGAPFDALITRRLTDAYTNVQAGQQILRIQDISEFRVKISVPEDILRLVGDPKMIQAEAIIPGTDKRYPLEYREHNTEADTVAQTYEVTFGMAPPSDVNLLPGMTVSVAVKSVAPQPREAYSVPIAAVDTSAEGGFRVWIYDAESGSVSPRKVEIGTLTGERVPVLSGLHLGEQIVAAGGQLLREGMNVHPMGAL